MIITINLSDDDLAVLQHDLVDPAEWIQQAVNSKVHKCRSRLINQELPKLIADPDVSDIPADESQLVKAIRTRPDYKDRKARDEEQAARIEEMKRRAAEKRV